MQCPVVITPDGKITTKAKASLSALAKEIDSWQLQPTRYFMSQEDFDDIVRFRWGSGK